MIFCLFRSLLEAGGVDRLMLISRHRQRFSSRVVKFASQVLYSMWVHQELREVYRKAGWKETDFVTKTIAARNARPNSPTNLNSTLNRPMASQSGTRYEDRTMQRGAAGGGAIAAHMNNSAAGYMVRNFFSTVWKFGNILATEISREINFCVFRVSKYGILTVSAPLDFDLTTFLHFCKVEIC